MEPPILIEDTPKRGRSADDTGGDQRLAKRVGDIRDFNNTIIVLVGPEETPFSVHQEAICDKSKFFKAACSKRWIEGQEKLVRLPEAKVEALRQYCKWIYSGAIPASRISHESNDEDKVDEQDLLVGLYLSGDSLDDIQLRNLATQGFRKSLESGNSLPSTSTYADIWSSTPSGSLFRKQIVDIIVARQTCGTLAKTIANYPPELVLEIALAAMRKVPLLDWEEVPADKNEYLEPEESKDNAT